MDFFSVTHKEGVLNKRYFIRGRLLICLILMAFCLGACFESGGIKEQRAELARNASARDRIIIGAAGPWDRLSKENMYRQGMETALAVINSKKLLGRQMHIIWKDDNSSTRKGMEAAQEFSDNMNMVAVLGHYDSYVSDFVAPVYEHAGLLMIAPSSMNTGVMLNSDFDLVFQAAPGRKDLGRAVADYLAAAGLDKIIVYSHFLDLASNTADVFENQAFEAGLDVVDRKSYSTGHRVNPWDKDLKFWQENYYFDAFFITGEPEYAADFTIHARKKGVTAPVAGTLNMDSSKILKRHGDAVENLVIPTLFHPKALASDEFKKFKNRFKDKFGKEPDAWAVHGYDSLMLLAHAVRSAESTVPAEMSRALKTMPAYQGISGKMGFDSSGTMKSRPIYFKKTVNGRFEYLDHVFQPGKNSTGS